MNNILFYSGAFRGYAARLRRAKFNQLLAGWHSLKLIVTANGRVR